MARTVYPPGPPARLLTGHLADLRRDPLDLYARCGRLHADAAMLRFRPAPRLGSLSSRADRTSAQRSAFRQALRLAHESSVARRRLTHQRRRLLAAPTPPDPTGLSPRTSLRLWPRHDRLHRAYARPLAGRRTRRYPQRDAAVDHDDRRENPLRRRRRGTRPGRRCGTPRGDGFVHQSAFSRLSFPGESADTRQRPRLASSTASRRDPLRTHRTGANAWRSRFAAGDPAARPRRAGRRRHERSPIRATRR